MDDISGIEADSPFPFHFFPRNKLTGDLLMIL